MLGIVCAFMSSVTWAIGVSAYALLARRYSPFVINSLRAVFSLPFFVLWLLVQGGGMTGALHLLTVASPGQVGWLSLSVLASYALGDVFFMISARSIGVPSALAIASTYPLFSALAASLFQGQHLSLSAWWGLVVIVLGTALVILSARETTSTPHPAKKVGILLAFLTALAWSLNTYCVARGTGGLETAASNTYRMLAVLCFCPMMGWFFRNQAGLFCWPATADFRKYSWAFLVEACLGASFFTYGLAHAPLGIAAALTSLAPVLSVPVALVLRTERFSLLKTLGVGIVVAGLFLLVH